MILKKKVLLFILSLIGVLLLYFLWENNNDKQNRNQYCEDKIQNDVTDTDYLFDVKVLPLFDNDYLPVLLKNINNAEKTITISTYLAQTPNGETKKILTGLLQAIRRGIKVKALFEDALESNHEWVNYLNKVGGQAKIDSNEYVLHEKVVLIDDAIMIVGSHNWSNAALVKNREASVLLQGDTYIFQAWKKRFSNLFSDGSEPVSQKEKVRIPVPDSSTTIHSKVLSRYDTKARVIIDDDYPPALVKLIDNTDNRILSAMYFLSDKPLLPGRELGEFSQKLFDKMAAGLKVEIILDQMSLAKEESPNEAGRNALLDKGVKVRYDSPAVTHHVKAVVGDNRYSLLGSHNWTISSCKFNKESSVLIDSVQVADIIEKYIRSIK